MKGTILFVTAILLLTACQKKTTTSENQPKFRSGDLGIGTESDKEARFNYMREMLADPKTGKIPAGIRVRELKAALLADRTTASRGLGLPFKLRGPANVGGRTRALAADIRNENVILAGSVSGGVWKTIDGGITWRKTTDLSDHPTITALIQDTRPGNQDTWYTGGGELRGNSASASFSAPYSGNGIFKSVDNGETWEPLPATQSNNPHIRRPWDYINRLVLDTSRTDSTILYAAIQSDFMRSNDGGTSWNKCFNMGSAISGTNTDVAITGTGVVYAVHGGTGSTSAVYKSNDGISWSNITPAGWPGFVNRMVIGIDPNDENRVYFFGSTPGFGLRGQTFSDDDWSSLWKYNASGSSSWINLSSNLPTGPEEFDDVNTQGGYNLVVEVMPGDSNFVVIGGTNLYKSTTGFTDTSNTEWFGGYQPGTALPWFDIYKNHHPDNHGLTFLSNSNQAISYHDGGISRTNDITATPVVWTSLNQQYFTTQFYTVGIDPINNNSMVFGGLQDNGTYWTDADDITKEWAFPSTGDGAFCETDGFGNFYYSRQNGRIGKFAQDPSGNVTGFQRIDPAGASGYRFINPFTLDKIDTNIMYLPAGDKVWRNNDLGNIPLNGDYDTISQGWEIIYDGSGSGTAITSCVTGSGVHRVYLGMSGQTYRIDSADAQAITTNITPSLPKGNYITDIAVNPNDADELIVCYSNYNANSLVRSTDGGGTWQSISGNFEIADTILLPYEGPGPSTRTVAIAPYQGQLHYFVGTSVGLYSCDSLAGDSTEWKRIAGNTIGNAIVTMLKYRENGGYLIAATHGNGIFEARLNFLNTVNDTTGDTIEVVGLQEQLVAKPSLYPNPATDYLRVSSIPNNTGFKILNLKGQEVLIGNTADGFIYIEKLETGAYLLDLGLGIKSQRFIKF